MIHGGPGGGDHAGFKPVMPPLADAMQLVRFDHRGEGRSGRGDPALCTLDENVEDIEALRRALRPGGFLHSYDLRCGLPGLAVPTLVLAGRHDRICAPEISPEIHRLVAGPALRILENSSHSMRLDEPEGMLAAILGFVA